MKTRFALWALALLTAGAPAAAQGMRAYSCTDTASNQVARYLFGPGEFHTFNEGSWGPNWCSEQGSSCAYEGSKFAGSGDGWDFSYDASTAAYSYGDEGGDEEKGYCRPE